MLTWHLYVDAIGITRVIWLKQNSISHYKPAFPEFCHPRKWPHSFSYHKSELSLIFFFFLLPFRSIWLLSPLDFLFRMYPELSTPSCSLVFTPVQATVFSSMNQCKYCPLWSLSTLVLLQSIPQEALSDLLKRKIRRITPLLKTLGWPFLSLKQTNKQTQTSSLGVQNPLWFACLTLWLH